MCGWGVCDVTHHFGHDFRSFTDRYLGISGEETVFWNWMISCMVFFDARERSRRIWIDPGL